jgi:DNA-binding MarR family transcriptional regulator
MTDNIEEIVSLIFSTRRTLHEQKDAKNENACSHLQMMTLLFVKEQSPVMKSIAEFLKISPPSATALVNNLIKAELVERREQASDRRIVKIVIAKKGSEYLLQHKKMATERMREVLSKLSKEEQNQLIKILKKIIG